MKMSLSQLFVAKRWIPGRKKKTTFKKIIYFELNINRHLLFILLFYINISKIHCFKFCAVDFNNKVTYNHQS